MAADFSLKEECRWISCGNQGAMSVSAATNANSAAYSGYVKKTADLVTDSLYKTTLDDGTNKVTSIPAGEALCSWINNYLSRRVTEKANYDSTGKYTMKFTTVADIENPGIHLSTTMTISTRWYEFDSAYTSGTWSPDSF